MTTATQPQRASGAASPWSMGMGDWLIVAKATWAQAGANNVGLIAAGVAFYCFTAIAPTLASIVLSYGLIVDAETVSRHVNGLFGILPQDAAALISDQLVGIVETSAGQQGLGLVVALGIAFYGVTKATSSMIVALNVAYDAKETRGFLWSTALSFLIVLGGVALVLTALGTTAALAFLGTLIPGAPGVVLAGIRLLSYLLLAGLVVTATAALYRYAPDRPDAAWVWLSPGVVIATAVWLAATAGFGFYVSNFGDYNATYGSLGAVVVLLTWLWLSAYVFLIGAELNGELERQATADGAATRASAPPAPPTDRSSPSGRTEGAGGIAPAMAMRLGSRVAGARIGLPSSLLVGVGLARLRRGSPVGAVIVAGVAAVAWLTRRREAEVVEPSRRGGRRTTVGHLAADSVLSAASEEGRRRA